SFCASCGRSLSSGPLLIICPFFPEIRRWRLRSTKSLEIDDRDQPYETKRELLVARLLAIAQKHFFKFVINRRGLGGFRHHVRVPPLVAKREESGQNQYRRNQHDQNAEVQHLGPLRLLRGRRAKAHHALREGARSHQRREPQNPFHCTLMFMLRSESGMK